ncbi:MULTISPECIES: hypothetical protein [Paraburkholderia]|uniref:hypothetical protein n=1 Tax=Paraburkholderia TaxID=1822464 RepID=UPI001FE83B87|nr:hypothetical protein [Paraburkholderia podalyriae]
MTDTQKEIGRRLSALQGLQLSSVNRAADMLTLGFGDLRPVTNFRGVIKHVGEWALHIQCPWRLEEAAQVVATQEDLSGSDERAYATADHLRGLLVERGPCTVDSVSVSDDAGMIVSLSRGFRLVVTPDGIEGAEDWRFFAPGVDAAHLVIKGGDVAPESFD